MINTNLRIVLKIENSEVIIEEVSNPNLKIEN